MSTIRVLDADNAPIDVQLPLVPGRAAASVSRPVVLSTEDKTALDTLATQTTAAAILAKIIAAPATAANQTTEIASLASIDTKMTTLAGYVDGLEALAGLLNGYTDGLEALIGTTNSTLSTLGGYVDGLEALATTLNTYVDGLEALVTSTNTKLDTLHTDLIAATPAGSALIGRSVADASAATGGISTTARLASAAASTNATNVKGSAGRVYSASGKNNAAYDVFLVLYDATTNPPVPGTTTIRKKIVCPAGQAFVYDWPVGLSFATGIGYAFTKLVADADTTVLVAVDITAFNLDYV